MKETGSGKEFISEPTYGSPAQLLPVSHCLYFGKKTSRWEKGNTGHLQQQASDLHSKNSHS